MTKYFKYASILPIAFFLIVFLSGCGGTDSSTESPQTDQNAVTSSASPAQTNSDTTSSSTSGEPRIGKSITITDKTPQVVTQSLNQKKPVLVEVFMTGPVDDSMVTKSLIKLRKKYSPKITFVIFNYIDAGKYGSLVQDLEINCTPATIILNGDGKIIKCWEGFVDEKVLEQGIFDSLKS